MAFVSLSEDESEVVGIFNMPQQEPYPEGYVGELPDNDERVIAFMERLSQ